MAKIAKIKARQILDSRGFPTIEADVTLSDGAFGRVAIPSGMSTGLHEAVELRDNDPKLYQGKSVLKAIDNIHGELAAAVLGMDAEGQDLVDETMIKADGTENKSRLGANAILAISLATAVAQAESEKLELFEYLSKLSPKKDEPYIMPFTMSNIINGGAHAPNGADFQEYMIVTKTSEKFSERLRASAEIFQTLKKMISDMGLPTTVGDEGGFAPSLASNTEAFDLIAKAIIAAGYKPGENVFIAIDIATSSFYKDGLYDLKKDGRKINAEEMINYVAKLTVHYPIISIEDPLSEDDFESWAKLMELIGKKIQIVGDDLYTTNPKRLLHGIQKKASNAILIKPNQIGTLTETIEAISTAYKNNFKVIISHRSGETTDTFIADLAVAVRADQVKFGSLSRSERLAKYDRLLQIEEKLKN
jgi:enolase